MLTGALVRVRFRKDLIVPHYIETNNKFALADAEALLEAFQRNVGHTRGELEQDLIDVFGDEPGQFVRRGLIKLLDDRCEWSVESKRPPEEIREQVFASAFAARQRSAFDRDSVLSDVAGRMQLSADEVNDGMFADLKSEQRLKQIDAFTPERLLLRYNVALVQSILLKADRVTVEVRRESPAQLRRLLRLVKFHRLVCELTRPTPDVVRMTLDGPLSMFTPTQKYGLQLALFVPAVLSCQDFSVEADLRWGSTKARKRMVVSPVDGLVSHLVETGVYVPPEVAMFATQFRKKIRDWELHEETDVYPLGDSFWVPDFRLVHRKSGKVVGLEILGFWRRGVAAKQLDRLRKHATMPYLLAVSASLRIDESVLDEIPNVIQFKQMPLPDAVADAATEVLGLSKDRA
jgi:uncharacterized protein